MGCVEDTLGRVLHYAPDPLLQLIDLAKDGYGQARAISVALRSCNSNDGFIFILPESDIGHCLCIISYHDGLFLYDCIGNKKKRLKGWRNQRFWLDNCYYARYWPKKWKYFTFDLFITKDGYWEDIRPWQAVQILRGKVAGERVQNYNPYDKSWDEIKLTSRTSEESNKIRIYKVNNCYRGNDFVSYADLPNRYYNFLEVASGHGQSDYESVETLAKEYARICGKELPKGLQILGVTIADSYETVGDLERSRRFLSKGEEAANETKI